MATHDSDRGIYRKFKVKRTDGSSKPGEKHARRAYFVLRQGVSRKVSSTRG